MLDLIEHGEVLEIRLNRPPVNALNPELVDALRQALEQAGENAAAVVLSGREGLFSAGLDVPTLLTLDRCGMSDFWQSFFRLLQTIASSPIPIVAAITGHSPAGGAVMALFCDYRIMAEGKYHIGLNEVQVGLAVPPVIYHGLVRLTGPRQAERLTVAGALVDPETARQLGVVDELGGTPASTVESAVAWCQRHLKLPRQAMLTTRATARAPLAALFEDFDKLGVESFVEHWFKPETQQVLQALVAQLQSKRAG